MGIAKVFCDDCDKWYKVKFESTSDLSEMKCPKCKSAKIWFNEIIDNDKDDTLLVIGRGGRRQK